MTTLADRIPMTDAQKKRPITREFFLTAIQPLVDECKALKRRVHELEAAQTKSFADAYDGLHLRGKEYQRGQLVTFGGNLWLAMAATKAAPGDDSTWKLVVKAR